MLKNFIAFGISIFVSTISYSQTDSCSTLADLTSKSNPNSFVGYGSSSSQNESDNNAQIDLASRIRQTISSSSTVTSTNESSNLNSTSKSLVSEVLIDSKILKRCSQNGVFSTVVTLDKKIFINSLEQKLLANISKAQNFIKILNSQASDEILSQNIENAKKFIVIYRANFENDIALCKTYNGCQKIKNVNIFSDLSEVISKNGDKDQFVFINSKDDVSESFKEEIITLLEKKGIKFSDFNDSEKKTSVNRKIYGKCKAKIGPKIPGSNDHVLTVTCSVESYLGTQKKFREIYTCKSIVSDEIGKEDGINACSGRLQLGS